MTRLRFLKRFSVLLVLMICVCLASVEHVFGQSGFSPKLTEYRVVGVLSPQYQRGTVYDDVPKNATITTNDHGGGGVVIVVFERGYASVDSVTFNGQRMTLVDSKPIWGVGNLLIGWFRYYYSPANYTRGDFRSTARSQGWPWNTMSTRLTIR